MLVQPFINFTLIILHKNAKSLDRCPRNLKYETNIVVKNTKSIIPIHPDSLSENKMVFLVPLRVYISQITETSDVYVIVKTEIIQLPENKSNCKET